MKKLNCSLSAEKKMGFQHGRARAERGKMLTKDFAICIRATDFSETSQIVTFFTRATGKIKAIAKGSKRPKSAFDGAIEVFSHGKIVFADSTKEKLATLTEFEQELGLTHLSENLFAFNCCLLATELLSNLTNDYDPHTDLFDSFLEFLQNTNERQATRIENRETLVLLILFQLALLKEVGLQPILSHCVNCKTKHERRETRNEVYFSSSVNGLVCRDCEGNFPDRIKLGTDAAACLTNLKMLAKSNETTLNEVEKILIHHFTNTLGRPPKMAKYILENQKP
ncbi:MAG: DNA repair protein RecO [Phycisphaerae bacterium]|nr:DNA repair protein RecO [Phycisphaerae bacterium]